MRIFRKPRTYGNPHPLPPPKVKIKFNNNNNDKLPKCEHIFSHPMGLGNYPSICRSSQMDHCHKYQNMPINAYKNHLPKLTSVKAMEGSVVLWPFQHMSIK
jgi:hypothetical protein